MPTRDIASDLQVIHVAHLAIDSNTTTYSPLVDVAHFDGGVMFYALAPEWNDGTYVYSLQDSPDDIVWTDIPADKLIGPYGSVSISAQTLPGDNPGRIGAFSANRYMRVKVVSTAVTEGNPIEVAAVLRSENRPIL